MVSADERDAEGLSEDESLGAVKALQGQLDYVHIVAGTSASLGGAVHIVPPMAIEAAYLAREAGTFKASLDIPLFVTGRINQPQEAELILARGQADVCGMTRALICDPLMPTKTEHGRVEDVRACIACNQWACKSATAFTVASFSPFAKVPAKESSSRSNCPAAHSVRKA